MYQPTVAMNLEGGTLICKGEMEDLTKTHFYSIRERLPVTLEFEEGNKGKSSKLIKYTHQDRCSSPVALTQRFQAEDKDRKCCTKHKSIYANEVEFDNLTLLKEKIVLMPLGLIDFSIRFIEIYSKYSQLFLNGKISFEKATGFLTIGGASLIIIGMAPQPLPCPYIDLSENCLAKEEMPNKKAQ